ncbi:poly [ADP-ribose] polymerase 9 [Sinocyclocheilus grahami]|uniref:poly [ADP-ribose] polymerase 9 n=1 Tax=Sinocyclocheilus grahami TaxID=75366 RepID=UPI0007AD30CA|nr:PREDICTED: poly [ADP-ribose] polymerase 9 [Sinocyclocheilus grahami]XP_016093247.1 PREDICTED: poly [ADP-ribose] polymerase 9 [Sinocyclocheilus grahami]XP_016093248.1 PREDICTED: poly [ADP-ribose] polymerase 9 [Sinocyclocheilus grahami]XP_016093249.1 PREDICTED: poly [ADP-ribose] polymerase 9 [Sinocyclocheilus grahami]
MSDIEQNVMPLVAGHAAILGKCKSAFCHAVKEKFNCTAILHNVEEAGSFGRHTSGDWSAEMRYSAKLSNRVEVSVWKDDLTRHKVDAVVNAANEKLNHGGGLAQALSECGGPMIQKWSDDIIQKCGKVKTGEAVLTRAGKLPCSYIIHAVGPKVSQNPSKKDVNRAAPLLSNTVISILQTVVSQNITSVAIPALSSGLFNFPRDCCADIIVDTIKQFYENGRFRDKNVEIHLVNNDEPTVQEMERATRAVLYPTSTSASYSGAVKGQNQTMTSSSCNSLRFENITLHLKKGSIEEEKVDVIVNTIAPNCDLSQGLISRAILTKAGNKIQDEIYKNKNTTQNWTRVNLYATEGYNLNCLAVFHTVCTPRSEPKAAQILYSVVWDSLKKTASNYKSISFPAIGTGNLGFKKLEVAKIMTDAVKEFAKQNTKKKLDVNLVVFPKDNEMMEAFENEMKKMKGEAMSPEVCNDMTSFGSAAREIMANKTPTVEFISRDSRAQREATSWTFNMLSPSDNMIIKNNHVIYLDQGDHKNLLSLQTKFNVHIKEFFRNGNGGITITGNPSDVSCAAIEVESMLCKAQEDFAQAEECGILFSVVRWSCKDVPWIQTPEISAVLEKAYMEGQENHMVKKHKVNFMSWSLVDDYGKSSNVERTCLLFPFKTFNNSFYTRVPMIRNDFEKEARNTFSACELSIEKVEKLENIMLQQLFKMNRQRVKDKPKRLYQRVSAQFCDLICRVGFQKEFAPPAEQKYGSGIYFSSTVDGALKLWKEQKHEQYIYIIQAQVLTGTYTIGSPQMILPPSLNADPLDRFDSLSDMGQTHIIFSGQQALPEYLIICSRSTHV